MGKRKYYSHPHSSHRGEYQPHSYRPHDRHKDNRQPKQNRSTLTTIYRRFERFSWRHPIASVGLYLFVALVLFRIAFLDASFAPYTHLDEIRFWVAVIATIMVGVALLSARAWWKRNVPDVNIRGTADVTWRNR